MWEPDGFIAVFTGSTRWGCDDLKAQSQQTMRIQLNECKEHPVFFCLGFQLDLRGEFTVLQIFEVSNVNLKLLVLLS